MAPVTSFSDASLSTAKVLTDTSPNCYVFKNVVGLARHVAQIIANVIREKNALGQNAVLALPAGSTPISVYRELVELHKRGELDFSRVITFNLDEYFGLPTSRPQSFNKWMHQQFFDHINIPKENIHIPNGMVDIAEADQHCREYEEEIRRCGGIDLAILGIGGNGHVGFNEPFSPKDCRTRLCLLDPLTRRAASGDFFGEENVPSHGITMGLGTILDSSKIILMAMGEHKSGIVAETVYGSVSTKVPASLIKDHPDSKIFLDEAAAGGLLPFETPWAVGQPNWDNDLLCKRAVLWLSEQTGKALLKLSDEDFRKHNLHQLLRRKGPAHELCQKVFRWMMETIEYHPAGREPKRVICFSPHPDDDVISMGGTLIRLNEDGHEVHIAYMTSGNIAVFDHDAQRLADLVTEYNRLFGIDTQRSRDLEDRVNHSFREKPAGMPDIEEVRNIKSLIRWGEAKAGAIKVGCNDKNCHFLDLPFYRTGTVEKKPHDHEDIQIVKKLILDTDPQQVYVAGDLSDPHGTHRVCAEIIFAAVQEIEEETGSRPEVLLYRGAWQEYPLHEIEIAIPLSPSNILTKRKAIFMHESQKDEALFPGSDPREFWQRAEDRNKGTADKYNQIGLPEYFALEAFVVWDGKPI